MFRARRVANERKTAYNIVYRTHSFQIKMSLAILYADARLDAATAS